MSTRSASRIQVQSKTEDRFCHNCSPASSVQREQHARVIRPARDSGGSAFNYVKQINRFPVKGAARMAPRCELTLVA
jgi:hypothetical protein